MNQRFPFVLGSLASFLLFWFGAEAIARPRKEPPPTTVISATSLFERFRSAVVKVSLIDKATGEQEAVGTGFFVSSEGQLITNYHVVAEYLHRPERYRLRIQRGEDRDEEARVQGFDLANDLALLRTSLSPSIVLQLHPGEVQKGTRVYSLGHPLDLGSSIIEGTYNGIAEREYPERIHFSGPINSGMSGGPTLLTDGSVVGVNVSTYGNEVGLLVPVRFAEQLLKSLPAVSEAKATDSTWTEQITRQLLAYQDDLVAKLMSTDHTIITKEGYRVPGGVEGLGECWSDFSEDETHSDSELSCSAGEEVFVNDELSTGSIGWTHTFSKSERLNVFQFYALLREHVDLAESTYGGSRRDFGSYRCVDTIVSLQGLPFKVWQCLRAYRRLSGLYDGHLVLVSLNEPRSALHTWLSLTGVTFANYEKVTERFLSAFGKVEEKGP